MDKLAAYYFVMSQDELWDDISDDLEKLAAPATAATLERRREKALRMAERGATEGERASARAAVERLDARLAELRPTAMTATGSPPPRGPSNGSRTALAIPEPPRRQIGSSPTLRQIAAGAAAPRQIEARPATQVLGTTVDYVPTNSGTRKGMSTAAKAGLVGLAGLAGLGGLKGGAAFGKFLKNRAAAAEAAKRRKKLLAAGAGVAGLAGLTGAGAYMAGNKQ